MRIFHGLKQAALRRRRARETPPALPDFIENIRIRATQGHVPEQVRWGDILLDSIYVPSDPQQARKWYEIAASADYAPAHNMLGRCHHFGWGGPIDLPAAAASYEKAARLGDLWGCYNLGIMTMRGIGMPADLRRALALFRSAAERGHAKSMNLVARFTEEGWHTERNPAQALAWYRRSAEGGDYRGQHNYASALLAMGEHAQALDWWRRAAGDATSDVLLAMERTLHTLGPDGDAALLQQVRDRLDTLGIPRPTHD
ncbi:tetratricopeptide repeat protein [Gluconacetobacter takamatsuzukensis]|uniref:Sel1 repeat family protein n=1 Tax=Gluconacetobacter takamatsuzukensis TaxID=1286190 RepID=A0A7W4PNM5_9PROT|nr:tetratricopeptide repeat protein [Gluconacetobacter takamatsuzukensis]MBB2204742.1 sel1 repeat family protein [Gluconacetobacter takamatsuzukensis]